MNCDLTAAADDDRKLCLGKLLDSLLTVMTMMRRQRADVKAISFFLLKQQGSILLRQLATGL